MTLLVSIVQIALALHTVMGAIWKFSKSAGETMPSLAAIPDVVWRSLGLVELICAVFLILPLINKRFAFYAPVAAAVIAAEMLTYCGLHVSSGDKSFGPLVYWLIVAALCVFVAFIRGRNLKAA